MDSPRKKAKIDSSPHSTVILVPESPLTIGTRRTAANDTLGAEHSAGVNIAIFAQSEKNRKNATVDLTASSDDDARLLDVKRTKFGPSDSVKHLPSRPNMSMRRAGFPSQQPNQQSRIETIANGLPYKGQYSNGSNQASTATEPDLRPNPADIEQMRQHAQAFQYEGSAATMHNRGTNSNVVSRTQSPGSHLTQSLHQQSSQHFYPPPAYNANQQQFNAGSVVQSSRSMADQYSTMNRPRQRLVQRDPTSIPHPPQSLGPPYQAYQASNSGQYANVPRYPTYQHPGHSYTNHHVATVPGAVRATVDPALIARLSEVFPHLPDVILRKALVQARGNVDDAQALIADDRINFDREEAAHNNLLSAQQLQYQHQQQQSQFPSHMLQDVAYQGRALPASTKRNIKAPNLSIREKQALRTAQTYPGQYQPQTHSQAQAYYNNPYMTGIQQQMYRTQYQQRLQQQDNRQANQKAKSEHIVPAYEAPKLRTRAAKKGPKIDIGSDESEDDAIVELESEGQDDTELESDDENDKDDQAVQYVNFDRLALESRVLHYINEVASAKELADLASCTIDIASFIIDHRPFVDLDQIKELDVTADGKRPSRTRKTAGLKVVEMSTESMEGYEAIDSLVVKCENYGRIVKDAIAQWGVNVDSVDDQCGALDVVKIDTKAAASKSSDITYLTDQPVLLPDAVRLKDYQLFGVNWLHLMYQKQLSGILADEMGLGKTCQVISFLGVLLHKGKVGPHLIVVPASTLENWLREISRFCPSLKVEAYYGSQRERNEFRDDFEGEKRDFNIMVTTYQLATGAKEDRTFLKRQSFDVCVYDEGHNLKNSSSSRYKYLMAVKANFRVLLTGTPLQNNLKELISLLSFVLPKVFAGSMDRLDSIFKIKAFGDSETLETALLSQQRIKRAKSMMTPFILRRYKKDVLSDLPKKNYRIDYVELNEAQKELYNEHLGTTRKALEAKANDEDFVSKDFKSAVNVMMQLRKCSNHPMLFRRQYDDRTLKKMAKALLKMDTFKDSVEALVVEDMEVMTDFELNRLCLRYPSIERFALEQDCWMQACKVQHLQEIVPKMKEAGDRILLFSQFTQTLDILEDCMDTMGITYFRLDGSTDVSTRQDLIDQFHEETDITVFLLSTKAGGFGINLACANVVIIYDSSFNPHDDKQAEDRAHRVGQTKEVQIIRLVAKDTIEEHIAKLANTKLTLDSSVSGDIETDGKLIEAQGEKQIAQTLISQLRAQ